MLFEKQLENDTRAPGSRPGALSNVGVFICDAGTGGAGSKIFKHVVFL